jgi:hypothetical protein
MFPRVWSTSFTTLSIEPYGGRTSSLARATLPNVSLVRMLNPSSQVTLA